MTTSCHAHIWCGEDVSYIMGIRVGGYAPHLGMVLTKGSLGGYSMERDETLGCDDRGDILLHPSAFTLEPGERYHLEWQLFWHDGEEDFYQKCRELSHFIDIETQRYVYEPGQRFTINITPSFSFEPQSVMIKRKEEDPKQIQITDQSVEVTDLIDEVGEVTYHIQIGSVQTVCRILIQLPIAELVRRRCRFLANKQQYHNPHSRLDGAFLIYDNEEQKLHYDALCDHNAGRERIVMGTLLASYLQIDPDPEILSGLNQYADYVYRELFDDTTGEVFQDAGKEQDSVRLAHYPWMAQFFIEMYILTKERKYVTDAYLAMKYYYEHGGLEYYAVEVPDVELIYYMEITGMECEIRTMQNYLYHHARYMMKIGTDYPAYEVKFDQRTVASAAVRLMKCSMSRREKGFLAAAEEHLKILSYFSGHQPDYRLYESAIRHWDGYFFAKRASFGDTFPNHQSALTGNVWGCYAEIIGKPELRKKAQACFDSAMGLFYPDGSATCVNFMPLKVNDQPIYGADPWANDQDFALYYAWKFHKRQNGLEIE
jgi:hypothetical protein